MNTGLPSDHPAGFSTPVASPGQDCECTARLLVAGAETYACMRAAIGSARASLLLEMYIWKPGRIGDRFLAELCSAAARGVQVRLLLDAFGSDGLSAAYFQDLEALGASVTWFNPSRLLRYSFRNHRKLMVVDDCVAVVGGLNIADEYDGDGVVQGWRDFAVELRGEIVPALAASFERMLELAEFTPFSLHRFVGNRRRLRHTRFSAAGKELNARLLLSGPGTQGALLRRSLRADLVAARDATVYAAYLLPTLRVRRALRAVARRGRVRLMTGARSDVPMVRWAAQRLYSYWLRGGVALYEYLPQVVHAKLIAIDDLVYVGSANLDARSLRVNYELLVRIHSAALAAQVREVFAADMTRASIVDRDAWHQQRHWWDRLLSLWAYLLLVRVDPYLARRGLKRLI